MKADLTISEDAFDPEAEHAAFRARFDAAGAIASFTGCVRRDGDVSALILSHYSGFTQKTIQSFAQEAFSRWPLLGLRIVHRVGAIGPAQPIVFVAAASSHRRDAFAATDYIMDYLKSEAPFWKQEMRAKQTTWIEPKSSDLSDKKRWSL